MLWYNLDKIKHISDSGDVQVLGAVTEPHCYRAPSWSWAKLDNPIKFGVNSPWTRGEIDLVGIRETKTIPLDPKSPFGRLSSASMVLCGHLLQHEEVTTQGGPVKSFFDSREDACIDQKDLFTLPIIRGMVDSILSTFSIIVQKLDSRPNCYKRVGLQRHHGWEQCEMLMRAWKKAKEQEITLV